MLGPNYAQWCNHHRVPESPDSLSILTTSDFWPDSRIEGGATRGYVPTASSSEIRDLQPAGVEKEAPSSSKTMANFKHLSYYDQLREIERQLVKLQDSYRRFPSIPQSQPIDLISDSPANPPNFQSIEEPIEGVLESPESICDSRESSRHSTMAEKDYAKDQVSTKPAIPAVLGTPSDADRLFGAGMTEENRHNRNLGGRQPEVVQEMELHKVEPNLVEAKSISDLKQGNGINSTLDLVQWDEKKVSSWIKNCDEWDFVALDDRLGIRNLDMQPLDVDDNVGTRQIESMMMKQPLVSAHEVFEKMPEKKMVDADEIVELLNVFGEFYGLIDSCSSFVFDPGKVFAFPLHTESAIDDFIGVLNTLGDAFGSVQSRSFPFDPGKHFELSFHTTSCVVCCGFFVEFVLQTDAGSGGCYTLTVVPEDTSSAAKFCGVYCCKFWDGIAQEITIKCSSEG